MAEPLTPEPGDIWADLHTRNPSAVPTPQVEQTPLQAAGAINHAPARARVVCHVGIKPRSDPQHASPASGTRSPCGRPTGAQSRTASRLPL